MQTLRIAVVCCCLQQLSTALEPLTIQLLVVLTGHGLAALSGLSSTLIGSSEMNVPMDPATPGPLASTCLDRPRVLPVEAMPPGVVVEKRNCCAWAGRVSKPQLTAAKRAAEERATER